MPASTSPFTRHRQAWTACVAALVLASTSGCTAHHDGTGPDPAAVVSSLGSVPVPTSPGVQPTPTASAGRVQLLAMGASVAVVLGGGTTATATASGPEQAITSPTSTTAGAESTPATIIVTVHVDTGTLHLAAADLVIRDEQGDPVPITPSGPATVDAAAGQTATLVVGGVSTSGAGAMSWQPGGKPLAIWDFTIELD